MRIRKSFRTEGPAHIVRNCSTDRCSKSIHGHTYHWELVLSGNKLDDAGMLVDFGLLGNEIKAFFDSFDHCHMMWNREQEYEFFKDYSERFVGVPFSPSAENMAIFALRVCHKIISNTDFANNEGHIAIDSVRVHETETGWAEATMEDIGMVDYPLEAIYFKHFSLWSLILKDVRFAKVKPIHTIDVSEGLV